MRIRLLRWKSEPSSNICPESNDRAGVAGGSSWYSRAWEHWVNLIIANAGIQHHERVGRRQQSPISRSLPTPRWTPMR